MRTTDPEAWNRLCDGPGPEHLVVPRRLPVAGGPPQEGVEPAALADPIGVATAVVYGVMVFVASLPGAAVLVAAWVRRTRSAPWLERPHRAGPRSWRRDGVPDV